MCDEHIHQGLVEDWRLSRRAVVGTLMASGLAGAAHAAAKVVERDVTITTPDGRCDAALFHPEGEGPWPAALMWPDIMGLRPVFRDMGRRLAAEGYTVLAPNLFYRSRKAPVVEGAFDFNDPAARARLFGYRNAMSDDGIDRDAVAYLGFLDGQTQTDRTRPAGVEGYCMGGPLAFRSAAAVPARIGAVATFHGGGLVTDKPDSPHRLIPRTRAGYLVAIARNDDEREPASKTTLRTSFAEAKRPANVEVFPADHGWCVPGSQSYDHDAAERAWAERSRLFARTLQQAPR